MNTEESRGYPSGMGERLKALRMREGKSQEEIAGLLGVSPQAYSLYERELRRPSYETLIRLGGFYKVTMDYLLLGEESIDRKLYDRLVFTEASRLPYSGKEELFHFMQFLAEKYHVKNRL